MGLKKLFSEKVQIDFNKSYGHLNDNEQRTIKILMIVQRFGVYFIFFAIGSVYSFARCIGVI